MKRRKYGYIAFLEPQRINLHLYELDEHGLVIDEGPIEGNEESYWDVLKDDREIQVCEVVESYNDKKQKAIATRGLAKIYVSPRYHSVEDMIIRSTPEDMTELFDSFYHSYVDMLTEDQWDFDD